MVPSLTKGRVAEILGLWLVYGPGKLVFEERRESRLLRRRRLPVDSDEDRLLALARPLPLVEIEPDLALPPRPLPLPLGLPIDLDLAAEDVLELCSRDSIELELFTKRFSLDIDLDLKMHSLSKSLRGGIPLSSNRESRKSASIHLSRI